MPSSIVCNGLTRDFGPLRALDGLTLSVPENSIFAFLGPNGAGKTTTIHLLLGIIEPSAGSARVLGLDPASHGQAIRQQSGALLEHTGLYERLSAEENLRFYARIAHLSREESDQRVRELLTRFDLYDRRAGPVGTWSRGMKQKLAIARALVHRPSLVFLDEPTAGLDPEATVALRRDIRALGTTVFLTTHNLTDVEKMATHVAVIRSGRLLDFGTPAELRRRALRSHVTIRMTGRPEMVIDLADGDSVAPIVTELVNQGAQIEEVRREEPSMEDMFLHLVRSAETGGAPRPVMDQAVEPPATPQSRGPLFGDIVTVIRKEWREITAAAGSGVSSRVNIFAAIALLAICVGVAALAGKGLVEHPAMLSVTMVAFIVLLGSVVDSFPGERERHTLETLLASAIPDEALLIGKMAAGALYGWMAVLVLFAAILAGVNVVHPGTMYPLSTILGVLVRTPLMLMFFSAAGVLVVLRVPTVRAAQPRLAGTFVLVVVLFVALLKLAPAEWRERAATVITTEAGRMQSMLVQIALYAILDVAVVALAVVRFRRSRLI